MTEVWKSVHGWPLYEASSEGRVRRAVCLPHGGARLGYILRVFWHPQKGHGFVTLSQGTRASRVTLGVHKVVALAFHGACPVGKEAAHVDHNPRNNRPDNLWYQTHLENMQASARLGRVNRGERHPKVRLSEALVRQLRREYRKYSSEAGTTALALKYGVNRSTIAHAINGRTWGWL